MSRDERRGTIVVQSLGVTLAALAIVAGVLAFVWVLTA